MRTLWLACKRVETEAKWNFCQQHFEVLHVWGSHLPLWEQHTWITSIGVEHWDYLLTTKCGHACKLGMTENSWPNKFNRNMISHLQITYCNMYKCVTCPRQLINEIWKALNWRQPHLPSKRRNREKRPWVPLWYSLGWSWRFTRQGKRILQVHLVKHITPPSMGPGRLIHGLVWNMLTWGISKTKSTNLIVLVRLWTIGGTGV